MTLSKVPQRVTIREVGPREGFQSFPFVVPTAKKLEVIQRLIESGLSEVEVTSFVRADRVPQMADAEELVRLLPEAPHVNFSALYLNAKGFERAEASGKLRNKEWLYTSPSDTFLRSNSNTTMQASLEGVADWCRLFRAHKKAVHGLMVSTAFGCEYEGAIEVAAVVRLVNSFKKAVEQNGETLSEVCLADTVGLGTPRSVEALIKALAPLGIEISLHLHDTRGLGLTNAYVGLQSGVRIFESSIGGIGGCPFTPGAAGNIATEDFVNLCESLGLETAIDVKKLCAAALLVEAIFGNELPGRLYKTYRRAGQR